METTEAIIDRLVDLIINPLILLVFAAGFIVFMWGLIVFLWNSREGEVSGEGKQHMLWGIVGMFVMISAWGILNILLSTFGIDPNTATDTSSFQSPNISF
jgi:hypothetical protein